MSLPEKAYHAHYDTINGGIGEDIFHVKQRLPEDGKDHHEEREGSHLCPLVADDYARGDRGAAAAEPRQDGESLSASDYKGVEPADVAPALRLGRRSLARVIGEIGEAEEQGCDAIGMQETRILQT